MRLDTIKFVAGGVLAACTSMGAFAQGGATCASAVAAFDGVNAYNNAGATDSPNYTGLCDMGPFGTDINYKAVWFTWTAGTTDTYTVSTCNTAGGVDSRLSAQTNCTVASVVACNDDAAGCAAFSSIMTFSATAGTTYKIAVGVYSATTVGGPGTFNISVGGGGGGGGGGDCCVANPNTVCCNDQACCDTVCAADPYCCATEWDQLCANQAGTMCGICGGGGGGCGAGGDCCVANPDTVGCMDTECCTTVCASDTYCCETEWDQLCADLAVATCASCGAGQCTLPSFAQAELELCGGDSNGGCNGGGLNEPTTTNNTIGGTFWASTAMRDTDWYGFTTTEGTEVSLTLHSYIPSFCALVDAVSCTILGTASAGTCPSVAAPYCLGPGSYYVVALPSMFAEFPCGGTLGGEYTLTISSIPCAFVPPAGDTCAEAVVANLGSNSFDNTNANTSYGEATCGFGGVTFSKDVFFSFTPTVADGYTLQTCDSSAPFDTGIEVWDGCPDAGGVMLFCNDDGPGCPAFTSFLAADLFDGFTYIIRVGGFNGATGATELNITQGAPQGPENDDCANAGVAVVGNNPFDTANSTTDGPNPTDASCGTFGAGFYNDVWYTFTAPATQSYLFSLCSATWDTRIDIYSACGEFVPLACNDDAASGACGLASETTLACTSGTAYTIRLGGYGAGNFGTGTMTISVAGGGGGGGSGLVCANPLPLVVGSNAFSRAGATVDLDYAGLCDMGPFGSDTNWNCVFYSFTPAESGHYVFSTCNAATHDTRLSLQTTCEVTSVVACNDDGAGCSSYTSIMEADLVCDQSYILAIGGYVAGTPLGAGTLNVSVVGGSPCAPACAADFNNDGFRDGLDMTVILSNWGGAGGDVNDDGTTDGLDMTVLLSGWGACP
ncbi:MAG: hypothetical protein EXS03_00180 [Phycisphaerales bacterium]|nr:hypothetical protein [Phycisphaerales bacterium]